MNNPLSLPVEHVKLVLIEGIAKKIRKDFDTQRDAAVKLQCHESVVSRLVNGNPERFSVSSLIELATRLGATIRISVN